jgi:hypothetical protein
MRFFLRKYITKAKQLPLNALLLYRFVKREDALPARDQQNLTRLIKDPDGLLQMSSVKNGSDQLIAFCSAKFKYVCSPKLVFTLGMLLMSISVFAQSKIKVQGTVYDENGGRCPE